MERHKIGICLIGCGRAGMIHAHNFNTLIPGAKMVAVVDAVVDVAKDAAAKLGLKDFYTDYRKALENPNVDAVVVAAPTDLHKSIVIDCANAGKHIFCEKPMAMNKIECEMMIEACDKNNIKLQLGFMRRFDQSFQEAKAMIEKGEIGDLVLIRSCTRGPSKPRPWMYDLKISNGILAEICSHDIDSIRWFAQGEVDKLFAIAGNFRNKEVEKEYPDYYDNVVVNGVFQNGIQFSIDGGAYVQYGYDSRVELVGTKGVLHVGRTRENFVECTTAEKGIQAPFISSWTTLFEQAYLNEDSAFIDCIIQDSKPKVTGIDGLMAVSVVEAGNLSIASGEVVRISKQ